MTEKITATEPFAFDMVSIQISCLFPYLRGLASVAYPLSWQCESLKGGISKQRLFPRLNRNIKHTALIIRIKATETL